LGIAIDRPRRAMAVRLARLAALLHVGEHVEIRFGIVMQDAFADRRIVVERLRDERWIDQQLREPLGDLRQRIVERLRLQEVLGVGVELVEGVGHGRLPSWARSLRPSYTNAEIYAPRRQRYHAQQWPRSPGR